MSNNLYTSVQIDIAPKQAALVDALTEEAPLLAHLPVIPASNGSSNVYEKLLKVTGGSTVELDAPVSEGIFESELRQQNLSKISFKVSGGKDKIALAGENQFFSKRLTTLLRATGAAMETSIISDVLRNHAITEGNYVDCEGDSDDAQSSILAVRWGEDATIGLYSKQLAGSGKTFEIVPLYGGDYYEDSNGIVTKGMVCSTFLGVQIADESSVNAIVNIECNGTPVLPTASQIDALLLSIRANPSNSMLIMHPAVYNAIKTLVTRTYSATDGNANSRWSHWDGVPILTTYNYPNSTSEAVVS